MGRIESKSLFVTLLQNEDGGSNDVIVTKELDLVHCEEKK